MRQQIENLFKEIKTLLFRNMKRLLSPRYIQRDYKYIVARCKERLVESLETTRQEQNRKRKMLENQLSINDTEETWEERNKDLSKYKHYRVSKYRNNIDMEKFLNESDDEEFTKNW